MDRRRAEKCLHDIENGYTIPIMETDKKRGGSRPGSGRKPLEDGLETVIYPVRMSTRQREKLLQLGGAPWVRDRIDKAKLPKE